MTSYVVEPEVAGGLGENSVLDHSTTPMTVTRVHYELEGWLGSQLITSHPVYLASDRFVEVMTGAGLTGFTTDTAEVTLTDIGAEFVDADTLPHFVWFKVTGRIGTDDFALDAKADLVVSERALALVQPLLGAEVFVEEYRP